jgi:uncharacterized protein (TIGR02647 family)
MNFTKDNISEIELLMLYNITTTQEGIKIHKTAENSLIAAAQRLFEKGFITQVDGGYLTPLGSEAAEHTQALYTMLTAN